MRGHSCGRKMRVATPCVQGCDFLALFLAAEMAAKVSFALMEFNSRVLC